MIDKDIIEYYFEGVEYISSPSVLLELIKTKESK